jgi:hypothetical protein
MPQRVSFGVSSRPRLVRLSPILAVGTDIHLRAVCQDLSLVISYHRNSKLSADSRRCKNRGDHNSSLKSKLPNILQWYFERLLVMSAT